MAGQIALLIVGFVLTTVLGGALKTFFQRQTWKHQHEIQLYEQVLERASSTCYSLSKLIDRRLYRMVRLQAAIARCGEAGFTREDVETRMRAYDDVLFEWNDALNGNRAVVGTFFGEAARNTLETEIYERFAASGACLEKAYRDLASSRGRPAMVDCGLGQLNALAYNFVSGMTRQIRDGTVVTPRVGRSLRRATGDPNARAA